MKLDEANELVEIDVHIGLFGLAETIWESLLVCELNLHAHYWI